MSSFHSFQLSTTGHTDNHPGFELLQRHFYEGYNRILFRALELERREFDSPPYAASINEDYEDEEDTAAEKRPDTQHSVSITFDSPLALPELPPIQLPPLPPLSPAKSAKPARDSGLTPTRGPPVRRNTTQGVEGQSVMVGIFLPPLTVEQAPKDNSSNDGSR